MLYPQIRFWLSRQEQSYAVQRYSESAASLNGEEIAALWQGAYDYNESLSSNNILDPYTADAGNSSQLYLSTLNVIDGGIMGFLEIPAIDVELPIYHGTTSAVLDLGVGHLEGSSLPVGGINTHAVLTGHTGMTHAKLLNDLVEVQEGDEFYFHILDQVLAYRVVEIQVVLPSDVSSLEIVEDRDLATLITCTPYGINSHRLLVTGERTDYVPSETTDESADIIRENWWLWILILLILFGALLLLWRRQRKKLRKRENISWQRKEMNN